jgi:hypothetical protein
MSPFFVFHWGRKMDDEFCRERVRTVRALAEQADPFIKKRLLQLADHYERRIRRSEDIQRGENPDIPPRPDRSSV